MPSGSGTYGRKQDHNPEHIAGLNREADWIVNNSAGPGIRRWMGEILVSPITSLSGWFVRKPNTSEDYGQYGWIHLYETGGFNDLVSCRIPIKVTTQVNGIYWAPSHVMFPVIAALTYYRFWLIKDCELSCQREGISISYFTRSMGSASAWEEISRGEVSSLWGINSGLSQYVPADHESA